LPAVVARREAADALLKRVALVPQDVAKTGPNGS
jgi:hypothetical protein